MHTNALLLTAVSALIALSTANPLQVRSASPAGGPQNPPTCGVCNPISGLNRCDVSTSCINTGSSFHCACRAGFKATTDPANTWDQFRIKLPSYESLVFVSEKVACNTPCDDPTAAPSYLCQEVKVQECGGVGSSRKREAEAEAETKQVSQRDVGGVGGVAGCGKRSADGKRWMVCTTGASSTATEASAPTESP